ncbi:MAG: hypothetical protein IKK60_01465 [Clostridia bacterium]|nr:hypothetical protein [Clostridia bacterium]
MEAVQTVLDTIKGIIAAFKAFFEDLLKMFNEAKDDTIVDENADATV